ncbi:porin [Rhizobium sp. CFBP 8752]|uniref:porin n=1 Tax=Rhizobium sp. CFBP 8752 TaxID=2775301 RepID=UPI00178625E8|nr:porin [Rhizobium sp. CFBP 8752]MBD8663713.1 porin [Rhizobium sp. CFBP 8752]
MNIKSLLLGSAAALAAVSGAQAADAIVAAEPEPIEYVRVCDAFGTGYFYIPGTETCLKVGGRVRFDALYGDAYNPDADGLYTNTRAELYLSTASDTEWGALKTNLTARFDYNPQYDAIDAAGTGIESDGNNTRTRLMVATIELGGFAVGLQDSLYESFIDYAGNVDSDDVINYGPSEVNMVAYTYKGGNGFSAFAALEDDGQNDNDTAGGASDWPNVAAGLKYDTGNFMVGVTGGYDESVEEGAVKARVGGKFGAFTAFLMGGWNSDGDSFNSYAPEIIDGFGWGDWAVWGGAGYEFNEDLAANMQVSYSDSDVLSAVANLQWTPIQGFLIQPEIAYTKWNNATLDDEAWSGLLRFQRTF